jgi:hypothetical protein
MPKRLSARSRLPASCRSQFGPDRISFAIARLVETKSAASTRRMVAPAREQLLPEIVERERRSAR